VRQNGTAIREFRRVRGLTGADVARRAGILPSTLINIEAERRPASFEMLARIAAGLGVSAEAITRPSLLADPPSVRFSRSDVALIRRYDAGESITVIAASIGRSQGYIKGRLIAAGVQIRSGPTQARRSRTRRAADSAS
jgi:transcriptional regulator with XRE-family HTH domain